MENLNYPTLELLWNYYHSLKVPDRAVYAGLSGTTPGYLRKILYKWKKDQKVTLLDGALCRLLDEHSKGAVPRESLRPDIWPPLPDGDKRKTKYGRRASDAGRRKPE
jgi:hypothetical protein